MGQEQSMRDWLSYYDTASYNAWRDHAFEIVCISHLPQLHRALSLETMATRDFPWESSGTEPGAQVDLVIERPDKITYLCEMKCTSEPFSVTSSYKSDLLRKMRVFKEESKTNNAVQTVVVASAGFKRDAHADIVVHVVDGDNLFT